MQKLAHILGWACVSLNALGLLVSTSSERPLSGYAGVALAGLGDPLVLAGVVGELVGINMFSLIALGVAVFRTKKGSPLPGYGVAAAVALVAGAALYVVSMAGPASL